MPVASVMVDWLREAVWPLMEEEVEEKVWDVYDDGMVVVMVVLTTLYRRYVDFL